MSGKVISSDEVLRSVVRVTSKIVAEKTVLVEYLKNANMDDTNVINGKNIANRYFDVAKRKVILYNKRNIIPKVTVNFTISPNCSQGLRIISVNEDTKNKNRELINTNRPYFLSGKHSFNFILSSD